MKGVIEMKISFTVYGPRADAIERAERSSFYGIFGTGPASANGYVAARAAAIEYLHEHGMDPDWYYVSKAQKTDGKFTWDNAYILTITAG